MLSLIYHWPQITPPAFTGSRKARLLPQGRERKKGGRGGGEGKKYHRLSLELELVPFLGIGILSCGINIHFAVKSIQF
jgi:hypothetical protein